MQSSERRNAWIITIVVVDDAFRYFALEVIGGNVYGSPSLAVSGTFYTDGSNVCSDVGNVSSWSTSLAYAAASTSTGTALLASRISTRWCHWISGGFLGRGKAGRGSEVGCVGGWGKERRDGNQLVL